MVDHSNQSKRERKKPVDARLSASGLLYGK